MLVAVGVELPGVECCVGLDVVLELHDPDVQSVARGDLLRDLGDLRMRAGRHAEADDFGGPGERHAKGDDEERSPDAEEGETAEMIHCACLAKRKLDTLRADGPESNEAFVPC